MFIVIDGIDGSGKGTQVELVRKELEFLGKKVKVLDYPRYGYESAFMVKKYLNGEYGKNISPKLASIFYAIDRYDSFFGEKDSNFEEFDYIISNRYVSSNMIHQASKIDSQKETKHFLDWLYELEFEIFGIPKPDKVIFLNVTPEVSQKLLQKKEKRDYIKNSKNLDIHENDENHLKKARSKAMSIVETNSSWVKIDCVDDGEILPLEIITKKILAEIVKLKN